MSTYKLKATVTSDGKLILNNLPFQAGDKVEVTVREQSLATANRYPLRETTVKYIAPFDSVDEDAWAMLK